MKVFLAPNTSDHEIIQRAVMRLMENGIKEEYIEINYNTQELEKGDLYVSYDPPDLVIRNVYDKKANGIVKMNSSALIKL
jgi:hypothetical protein